MVSIKRKGKCVKTNLCRIRRYAFGAQRVRRASDHDGQRYGDAGSDFRFIHVIKVPVKKSAAKATVNTSMPPNSWSSSPATAGSQA